VRPGGKDRRRLGRTKSGSGRHKGVERWSSTTFWISQRVSGSRHARYIFLINRITVEAGRMTTEVVSYSLRQTVFMILKTLVVRASQNNLDLTYYKVESDVTLSSSVVCNQSRIYAHIFDSTYPRQA
jgi:hypothetical protein